MLRTTIYVYLLNEGSDAWRPVDAFDLGDGRYQIDPKQDVCETEEWEFKPGDVVRCRKRTFHNGAGLVALEKG